MDVHEFRRFANATIDYLVDYLENIRDRAVLPPVSPGYLQPLIPGEAPQQGEKWEDVLKDMDRVIMPGVTHWHSPQFHAYYPTSNSYPGIIGEMLCAGIGCLGAEWESSPACTELEVAVMDWLGKAMGLPKAFFASEGKGGGIIQGSASEATLINLFAAKERMLWRMTSDNPRIDRANIAARLVSYTSDQSNSSVEKAGLLGSMPMRLLRGDTQCRLRGPALEAAILEDKEKGLIPCYVVATLGTTGTCAFDALDEIGPICERHGLWLHIDAAYAGAAFICPEYRHHMRGVEMADSFNFNPHKWLLVNADCSAMWVKDSSWLVAAFSVDPRPPKRGMPDFHTWQIPADRRFRALKLWLVLRIYGVQGLQAHVRKQVELAQQFEALVDADDRFSVATDVLMGVVCFRLKGQNDLTERLITRLTLRRRIYLVSAFVGDDLVIRFVVCSRYSEPSDIRLAWMEIVEQSGHVLASPNDNDLLPVQVSPKDLLSVGLNSCNREPGGVDVENASKGSPAWGSDSSGICVDADGSWDEDGSQRDGEEFGWTFDDVDVHGNGWGDGKLDGNNNGDSVASLEEDAERTYSTMDAAEFRKFGKATVDYLADYIENVRDRPVLSVVSPGYLQPLIPGEAPQQGEKWEDVLKDMDRVVMPGVTHWHSPQFHAYYPTANSYPGIVGEMLSAGIGCVGFSWITSPACTELEVAMMDWLGKLMALPKEFLNCSEGPGGGVIQGSASEATLVGLLAAKDRMLRKIQAEHPDWEEGAIKGKMVAYTSDQSNSSVEKAGLLGSMPMRLLRSDAQCRLRGPTLEAAIREDRAKGLIPCYVVATLGTTGTCAFDDLEELGQICEREAIWLHVDAAYAGAAFICPEYRHHMQGVEMADSFNFNPHKWLLVNFDCSAMWVKNSAWLVDAFNVDRIYLKHHQQGVMPDYRHWQIPLGRRFRSLKLWLVLRIYGVAGLQAHIRKQIALTQRFETLADADERFSVVTRVSMGVVCFRLKGSNGLTKRLLDRLTARKKIYLVSAKVQEDLVIRFVICSRLTEERDVDFAWDEILAQAGAVLSRTDDDDLLTIPSEPVKSNGTVNEISNGNKKGGTNGHSNGHTNGCSNDGPVNGKKANGQHNGNGVVAFECTAERKVGAVLAKQMKVCEAASKQGNEQARLLTCE